MFYASSVVRAIRINFAFTIKDGNTLAVRIPSKSRWTFTVGPMVVYCTFSTGSTRIVNTARVDTSSISAGLTGCTFIITRATNLNWGN